MSGKTEMIPPQDRMSRRSDPQQERSRARQRALLDAAEEILGEVGADGLKMREVARRANLPIASVYHYFPSAPALIRTLVEHPLDQSADEGGGARKVVIDGGDRQIRPTRDLAHLEAVGPHLAQDFLGRIEQRTLARPATLLLRVASARHSILRRDHFCLPRHFSAPFREF